MTGLYIAIGFGLLCLGFAVFRVIAILRGPHRDAKGKASEPILMPEYCPGGSEERDAESSDP